MAPFLRNLPDRSSPGTSVKTDHSSQFPHVPTHPCTLLRVPLGHGSCGVTSAQSMAWKRTAWGYRPIGKGCYQQKEQLTGGREALKTNSSPESSGAGLSEQEGSVGSESLSINRADSTQCLPWGRLSQKLRGAVCGGFFHIHMCFCPAQNRGTLWEASERPPQEAGQGKWSRHPPCTPAPPPCHSPCNYQETQIVLHFPSSRGPMFQLRIPGDASAGTAKKSSFCKKPHSLRTCIQL